MFKTIICLLWSVVAAAQIPSYYQNISPSLSGEALKNELRNLVTVTHVNELVYTPDVWNTLKDADVNPENSSQILLIYGWNDTDNNPYNDRTRNRWASCHTSNCEDKWVREHVFPRSKGTPNLLFEGPGSDAHHLHAIDYERNGLRSNFKFAENTSTENGFSKVVLYNGTKYFYPGDEWKGDVARMIMYMYVRYGLQCQPVNAGISTSTHAPLNDMPDVFLQWNAEDPVSAHEIQRNTSIYASQGNRNPFIDNPNLATRIWKGPLAENKWETASNSVFEQETVYIFPTATSDIFNIEGIDASLLNQSSLSIYDASGKRVLFDAQAKKEYNITYLSQGYYYVQVSHADKQHRFKLIKK